MPRKELVKRVRRIVVKIGTSSLTEDGEISEKKIIRFTEDVVALMKQGYQVVVVSSGAITAGAGGLKKKRETLTIPEKQALAAVGQAILINEYRRHFERHGLQVGQILLTEDDLKHRRRYLNARHTMETLLSMGAVPIVNENDSVVVKEIKFGDNDTLSAHITSLVNADLLILLSDVQGFYMNLDDEEPVDEIHKINEDIIERAGGSGTTHGTGGMATKIRAAELIMRFGKKMVIAHSCEREVLTRIVRGERLGTIFVGREERLSSRKQWLALRKAKGQLILDDGAVEALRKRKKSLLATGIDTVQGTFDMGAIVELHDTKGKAVGKGIVNYNSAELDEIRGKSTKKIKEILGGAFFDEVVNRDDLIIY